MPVSFHQHILPNGLTILAEVDPAAHSAALGFFVKTGACDEQPGVMGVSHFLEHMMFKGTSRRSSDQVDRDFDNIGADHNAFTTSEMTAFHVHALPERLFDAEDVLSDIMRPALREEDFNNEKKVILEEIAMYDDYPFWVLYERALEEYYGSHPLSHRVLGTAQTISALSRDAMAHYFTNRYSADNTVVSAAGRVDFPALVERITAHCGSWARTQATRGLPKPAPQTKSFDMTSASVHQHYLLMICPGPSQQDDSRYAAAMLANVLGAPGGSRLFWALIETGLAEDAQVQHDPRDGVGNYMVYACSSTENAATVEQIVRREIADLMDSITQDDLERVRSKIATSITLHGELPAGRMKRLGRMWTYQREYRTLEDELKRLNAVTIDEMRAVCEQFPLTPVVTGRLAPAPSSIS